MLAISIPAHPRAQRSIRRIRARTAIAAFVLVLILSHRSGVPNQEAVMRALLAGLIGNLAGWGCALAVWRQLVLAEVRLVENARRERRRAQAEAAAEHAAARAAARRLLRSLSDRERLDPPHRPHGPRGRAASSSAGSRRWSARRSARSASVSAAARPSKRDPDAPEEGHPGIDVRV